ATQATAAPAPTGWVIATPASDAKGINVVGGKAIGDGCTAPPLAGCTATGLERVPVRPVDAAPDSANGPRVDSVSPTPSRRVGIRPTGDALDTWKWPLAAPTASIVRGEL